jgi:[ribosomal protein S5]-alanine N-acetyltransferase
MRRWIDGFYGAFTICDAAGRIVELSRAAQELYADFGGADLVGRPLLDCHGPASRDLVAELIRERRTHVYFVEKAGRRRLIYQAPWAAGDQTGFLELSLEIPMQTPTRVRDAGPEQPAIETERLLLRPLRPADAPRLAELAADRVVAEQTHLPHPYPPEAAVTFIDALDVRWRKQGAAVFGITLRGGELMGVIGLNSDPYDRTVAETGYWLGVAFHGVGYATEALRRLCRWGFEAHGLRRIAARTFAGNVRSERVLEKTGFRREGLLREGVLRFGTVRDVVQWGRLAEDPA